MISFCYEDENSSKIPDGPDPLASTLPRGLSYELEGDEYFVSLLVGANGARLRFIL